MALTDTQSLTRPAEIAAEFQQLFEAHFEDILHGRATRMYHTKDFAALLHLHPTHLSNTITRTLGKSPCELMEDRIIAEARRLLDDPARPVKEVCYQLTFNEPTNFTKFFKALTGETPTQYRARQQATQKL